MYIEQLYTKCLSEAAYYIENNGECAIIDPLRDTEAYLELAKSRGAKIKYIFETHFHADFVSGHLDLSAATNAPIVYGPEAKTRFAITNAKDGEVFMIGNLQLKALHTPGHTLESTCWLLHTEAGEPHAIFTGDTLFVGDVGRPDLFGGILSKEELAYKMYDSLQRKILPLPDAVIVYPAHGPGSSCGKNLGAETFSTIGEQRASNYALKAQSREQFIQEVTDGLNEPPPYFPLNAKINKEGYDSLTEVLDKSLQGLNANEFEAATTKDVVILDTRPAAQFTEAYVPNSIFIGLDGRFAEWAGTLLEMHVPILLVCEAGKEQEAVTRLARVGYDNVIGYLKGGFETWQQAGKPIDLIIDIDADELFMDLNHDDKAMVMDVRKETEFNEGHIAEAELYTLANFNDPLKMSMVDDTDNIYVHCAGGYRSVIACSILKRQGFHNLRNVLGGWSSIKTVPHMPIVLPKKAEQ